MRTDVRGFHEWRVNRLFREMGVPPQTGVAPLAGTNQPGGPNPVPAATQQQAAPDSDEDMKSFISQVGASYRAKAKVMMDSLMSQSQGALTPKKKAAVIALMLHGMGVNDPGELGPIFKLIKSYAQQGLLGQEESPQHQQ